MSEEEKDNSDKGERKNLIKNALNEHTNKKDLSCASKRKES